MTTPSPTPDLAAELADLDALEEAPVRKVLVSTVFAELFTARADDGQRLSFEWGEPDADGFYTPTITATDDGKVVVDAGELRSLRARPPVDVITEAAEIMARHFPFTRYFRDVEPQQRCVRCGTAWPCDVILLREAGAITLAPPDPRP